LKLLPLALHFGGDWIVQELTTDHWIRQEPLSRRRGIFVVMILPGIFDE